MVAAAQQSSTTMTLKLSSARLRTVEETHWSVKMPATTTFSMPMLCRIRRRLVPVSALSVVLVITISSPCGRELRHDLRVFAVLGQQQVVEARLLLAERAVAAVQLVAGDAGEDRLDAARPAGRDQARGVRDHGLAHAREERLPAGVVGRIGLGLPGRCSGCRSPRARSRPGRARCPRARARPGSRTSGGRSSSSWSLLLGLGVLGSGGGAFRAAAEQHGADLGGREQAARAQDQDRRSWRAPARPR